MESTRASLVVLLCLFVGISCQPSNSAQSESTQVSQPTLQAPIDQIGGERTALSEIPDYVLLQPEDLAYRGFFRLPEGSGNSNWDYSGHGLTFFPDGDPESQDDFPGSLFGFGHDHQLYVSEISIPAPRITRNLLEAPIATTLQPFADLTAGIFNADQMTIPRAGLAYLADPEPRLHFTFGQHFQDFEPSHGWAGLDLEKPDARGAWVFGEYTNYVTNDYLFEIPPDWAEAIAPGPLLASGRAREGLWSGRGPGLFVYPLHGDGNIPAAGELISGVLPLMLYGEQLPGQPDIVSDSSQAVLNYREADHWWGGAWLTTGERAAVVLVGTKALGEEWYGFANGVIWEHDCAENQPPTCPEVPEWPYDNRGFWAEEFQAELIFFDPGQLAAVAQGELDSWAPQPYAVLVLDEFLLDPFLDPGEYKRDLVGALAYDRSNGILYLVERLADDYRSVIHAWQITQ